jgi:phosphatidate cytidylyltransferase
MYSLSSLTQRILSLLVLVPLAVLGIFFGGWVLTIFVAAIVCLAGWELDSIFRKGDFKPSRLLLIIGAPALVIARQWGGFPASDGVLALLILIIMTLHTVAFEKGTNSAAVDFCITLGGVLYLGWLGSYIISLRNIPNGLWWSLLVLPAISFADGGAYLIGRALGRHKMAPVLSPKKTWEGYLGGILVSIPLSALLAWFWSYQSSTLQPWHGALIGLIMATIAPMGDFGESMLKRQFGVKDSSNLIPGHGGFLDRIDSFLWAGVLGYYLITLIIM